VGSKCRQSSKSRTSSSFLIDVEGPRVVLLGELNNFGLGDKIRAGLAAVANFDVFKMPAGHRSILRADSGATLALVPLNITTSPSGTFRTWPVWQTMSAHGGKADLTDAGVDFRK
jgi:hypothetical protein